jgi:hypothetical protein
MRTEGKRKKFGWKSLVNAYWLLGMRLTAMNNKEKK